MAKKVRKHTARGRKQDRARVAGGQDYEVRYESKKTRRSAGAVQVRVHIPADLRRHAGDRLQFLPCRPDHGLGRTEVREQGALANVPTWTRTES